MNRRSLARHETARAQAKRIATSGVKRTCGFRGTQTYMTARSCSTGERAKALLAQRGTDGTTGVPRSKSLERLILDRPSSDQTSAAAPVHEIEVTHG